MKIEFRRFSLRAVELILKTAIERGIEEDIFKISEMLDEMNFTYLSAYYIGGKEHHNFTYMPEFEEHCKDIETNNMEARA